MLQHAIGVLLIVMLEREPRLSTDVAVFGFGMKATQLRLIVSRSSQPSRSSRLRRDLSDSASQERRAVSYPALMQPVRRLRAPMESADWRLIYSARSLLTRYRLSEPRSDLCCHHSRLPTLPFHTGIDEPPRQLLRQRAHRILLGNVEERTGLSSTLRHARAGAAYTGESQLPIACHIYAALLSDSSRCLTRRLPRIPSDLTVPPLTA